MIQPASMPRRPTTCRLIFLALIVVAASACSPRKLDITLTDLPPGDAARGAALFTQSINDAPPCSQCHYLDSTRHIGPGFAGFGARAGTRVSGESAVEYTFHSVVQPSRYMVRGFSNVMYNEFAARLAPQDIADLIAYLLTL